MVGRGKIWTGGGTCGYFRRVDEGWGGRVKERSTNFVVAVMRTMRGTVFQLVWVELSGIERTCQRPSDRATFF